MSLRAETAAFCSGEDCIRSLEQGAAESEAGLKYSLPNLQRGAADERQGGKDPLGGCPAPRRLWTSLNRKA